MRIRLINLVGRQFCPTVLACGDRHAHNRTPTSARTTFEQLIFSKTVMYRDVYSIPHFVFFEAIAILGLFMLKVC